MIPLFLICPPHNLSALPLPILLLIPLFPGNMEGMGVNGRLVLKQQHYVQLCQPIRDIGWVQTLKQHLWRCALPDPSESDSAFGRVSDFYSSGTSGEEPEPQEPRSKAVVRFAPNVKY
ncbi:microtubule-associated protein 6 homolog [Tachysurus ichikawai]